MCEANLIPLGVLDRCFTQLNSPRMVAPHQRLKISFEASDPFEAHYEGMRVYRKTFGDDPYVLSLFEPDGTVVLRIAKSAMRPSCVAIPAAERCLIRLTTLVQSCLRRPSFHEKAYVDLPKSGLARASGRAREYLPQMLQA